MMHKEPQPYSMRLDFMTKPQINGVIQAKVVSLDDLCDAKMGCANKKDVILNKEIRFNYLKTAE